MGEIYYNYIPNSKHCGCDMDRRICLSFLMRSFRSKKKNSRSCSSANVSHFIIFMKTLWHRNKFRITSPLWGESIGHRWWRVDSPHKGPVTDNFDICFGKRLNKQRSCVIWDALTLMWRHRNVPFQYGGLVLVILIAQLVAGVLAYVYQEDVS